MSGKRAIVVGGTSGIGQGIALRLAKAKASVTILGRSRERGEAVVREMRAEAGDDAAAQFAFVECDAQMLGNVKAFADEFRRSGERLDMLVLTQGIATTQGFTPTSEGLDQKLSLHYFSRVAFALHLAPLMAASDDPRVLTVLSAGVHSPFAGYRDDFSLERTYSIANAANAAGFYNDIAVDSLSREFPDVSFVHAAPGFVNTRWGSEFGPVLRFLVRAIQPLGRSIRDAGELMSEALFSPRYKRGWHLVDQYGEPTARPTDLHEAAREFVWERTKEAILSRAPVAREGAEVAPAGAARSAE